MSGLYLVLLGGGVGGESGARFRRSKESLGLRLSPAELEELARHVIVGYCDGSRVSDVEARAACFHTHGVGDMPTVVSHTWGLGQKFLLNPLTHATTHQGYAPCLAAHEKLLLISKFCLTANFGLRRRDQPPITKYYT